MGAWTRPWNAMQEKDKDVGQKSPYSQLRTTNLGQAACRAKGAITTSGLRKDGARMKVNQATVKGTAGRSTGTFSGGYRERKMS